MYNIKIVGGGSAGLISALYLRRIKNCKITVFEKQPKREYESSPCAEGLSIKTLKKLEKDTSFDSTPFISKKVPGIQIIYPNGTDTYIHQKGVTINRTSWLTAMIEFLQRKNVEIRFNKLIRKKDIEKMEYDYLIGAGGPFCPVGKMVRENRKLMKTVQYKMKLDRNPNHLTFYLNEKFSDTDGKHALIWVFPKEKKANVGMGSPGLTHPDFKDLNTFIEEYNIQGDILEKQSYPVGVEGKRFEKENVFLIGGSGGLTNPLTGGGLKPIIICSTFLYRTIKNGRSYTKQIRNHSLNPNRWNGRYNLLHSKNPTLNTLGNTLNGEDVQNPSLASKLKILAKPWLWKNIYKINKEIDSLLEASW